MPPGSPESAGRRDGVRSMLTDRNLGGVFHAPGPGVDGLHTEIFVMYPPSEKRWAAALSTAALFSVVV